MKDIYAILHKEIDKKDDILGNIFLTLGICWPIVLIAYAILTGMLPHTPLIDKIQHPGTSFEIFLYVLLPPILLIFGFGMFVYLLFRYSKIWIKKLAQSSAQIENIYSNNLDISSILEKNIILRKIIIRLIWIHRFFFWINKGIKIILQEYIQSLIYRTYGILTQFRSDLTFRLTEQQQILEGAKLKVEKNIRGTTELEQVSEAQKMRLDKQIEQFEELQRVLVKA